MLESISDRARPWWGDSRRLTEHCEQVGTLGIMTEVIVRNENKSLIGGSRSSVITQSVVLSGPMSRSSRKRYRVTNALPPVSNSMQIKPCSHKQCEKVSWCRY
jgi:hypothetical protein